MILVSLPPTTAELDNALKFSVTTDLGNQVFNNGITARKCGNTTKSLIFMRTANAL